MPQNLNKRWLFAARQLRNIEKSAKVQFLDADKDQVLTPIVAQLRAKVRDIRPDRAVFKAIMQIGDIGMLQDALDAHGAAVWRGLDTRDQSLSFSAASGNLEMMKLLHSNSFEMEKIATSVFTKAIEDDNPQLLSWALDDAAYDPVKHMSIHASVSKCQPRCAPILLGLIKTLKEENSAPLIGAYHTASSNASLKACAFFFGLFDGIEPLESPVGLMGAANGAHTHVILERLSSFAASGHGKLQYYAYEPSLCETLSRPKYASFIGLQQADLISGALEDEYGFGLYS